MDVKKHCAVSSSSFINLNCSKFEEGNCGKSPYKENKSEKIKMMSQNTLNAKILIEKYVQPSTLSDEDKELVISNLEKKKIITNQESNIPKKENNTYLDLGAC